MNSLKYISGRVLKMNMYHKIGNKKYNIQDVNYIFYRKRLFCIFESNLPYEIGVEYNDPHIVKDYTFTMDEKFVQTSIDYIRIESEKECKYHIKEINMKKKLLDDKYLITSTMN